jgi:hypothetical protein
MGRKILGIVVGWITGSAIFLIFQMVASRYGIEPRNMWHMSQGEITSYMNSRPMTVYVIVLIGYYIGSLVGGWMTTKISQHRESFVLPLIVGVLFTLYGLLNCFVMFPGQPVWFEAASLIGYIPFVLVGHKLSRWG